jgi:hypothetical protein
MLGLCHIFTGLAQNTTYEVRLRHATDTGTLRTKNVSMVMLPLYSGDRISLRHARSIRTTGVKTRSTRFVDTDLSARISLKKGTHGAYILVTAAFNAESIGVGGARVGTWRIIADQGESHRDHGVPIQRYLSGSHDIGSVVLHALAGPFNASDGNIDFKLQHKTSKSEIFTFNGTLIAITLSDYDTGRQKQYDYGSGQGGSEGRITTNSGSLMAVHDTKTGKRVRVSPRLDERTALFVGATFNGTAKIPATVSYDIAEGERPQVLTVRRVTSTKDIGAGSLFGITESLDAGVHDIDLRHATTSVLETTNANLVYLILSATTRPKKGNEE